MPEILQLTAVLDIIGTCFSLEKPRQALTRLGAPEHALDLWFAQALRDSFAFSHAGGYVPLEDMLRAELARTVQQLGLQPSDDDLVAYSAPWPNWTHVPTAAGKCSR